MKVWLLFIFFRVQYINTTTVFNWPWHTPSTLHQIRFTKLLQVHITLRPRGNLGHRMPSERRLIIRISKTKPPHIMSVTLSSGLVHSLSATSCKHGYHRSTLHQYGWTLLTFAFTAVIIFILYLYFRTLSCFLRIYVLRPFVKKPTKCTNKKNQYLFAHGIRPCLNFN